MKHACFRVGVDGGNQRQDPEVQGLCPKVQSESELSLLEFTT